MGLDSIYGAVYSHGMNTNRDANQAKLDNLIREAQHRLPVGSTIKNKRGTARWNGTVWVYGR